MSPAEANSDCGFSVPVTNRATPRAGSTNRRRVLPGLASFLALSLTASVVATLYFNDRQRFQQEERSRVDDLIGARKAALESGLSRRLNVAFSMAAFAAQGPDELDTRFDGFARQLYSFTPNIRSIQVAPNAVVQYIYPFRGNEAAKGHDLMMDPQRRSDVERTIERGNLTLAGPLLLVQGGLALVGRVPIFVEIAPWTPRIQTEHGQFWGLGVVLIDIPPLLAEAGLIGKTGGIEFALRSVSEEEELRPVFLGDADLFHADCIRKTIELPDGSWELAARPEHGWSTSSPRSRVILIGGGNLALVLTIVTFFSVSAPLILQQQVEERTSELTKANLELEQGIDERKQLEEQFRQAQKMEAVGQLAGGIAHDFNNILQGILSYSELLMDQTEQGTSIHSCAEEILCAGLRAKTLVSQLLAFSRRQVLELKDVDLNDVVMELSKMFDRMIGEHISLDVIPGRDLGTVCADVGQVGQILMNLCVNARDAMPKGGTITIETRSVFFNQADSEALEWTKPGRFVLLSVTDTGYGMDQEILGKVFEPFFTTKEPGKGTGLGLSTVYGIVKQHAGTAQIDSEVGVGTTVKIYLPVSNATPEAWEAPIEATAQGGTETILLAEDDSVVRQLTQGTLEAAGYTVMVAANGNEAIRLFEKHADEINLALLDVMMPEIGGRAVYENIRAKRPQVRVLFASGYSMNAIDTNFMLDDGLMLIQKPYQRTDLLRKVREALDTKTT